MLAKIQRSRTRGEWWQLGLRIVGAVLLAVTAGVHLDLYLTGYRTIPTIGWLFLLQVITGFVLAAAVVVTRGPLAPAAGAGFALATLGGYLLSVWVGLFGFKEVRTTAGITAGVLEVAAFTALGVAAVLSAATPQTEEPASPRTRMLAMVRARAAQLVPAIAAVSIVALALLASALATASGPPPASAGGSVTLKTAHVGGVTVVTNAKGLTLYTFDPDTPTTSNCTGSCAAYWPPLTGTPTAGTGVTGKLGTIKRAGGGIQVTYNGHPLYTYVGDSGPGQANGNNLNLNGGLWHEARVSP
jgi:predicted lipoprotein with Yx(FWY)xxD motif